MVLVNKVLSSSFYNTLDSVKKLVQTITKILQWCPFRLICVWVEHNRVRDLLAKIQHLNKHAEFGNPKFLNSHWFVEHSICFLLELIGQLARAEYWNDVLVVFFRKWIRKNKWRIGVATD